MQNFFNKDYKDCKQKIFNAFPEVLRNDVKVVVEILLLDQNIIKLCDEQFHKVDNLISSDNLDFHIDAEQLSFPYRIYFDEPTAQKEEQLNDIQKIILNCIYLRHHNGYIRQRRLENLLESTEYWVIPFTLQLLGEYVYEILEVLDKHINANTINLYTKFIRENPRYWMQTESRMISYWDAYYRTSKSLKLIGYLGYKIVKRIKLAME